MKSKLYGLTICALIFSAQTIDLIFWRDDYPFTKWGMYKSFPDFKPYMDVFITVEKPGMTVEGLIKDPWDFRERIWTLVGLGNRSEPFENRLPMYYEIVQTNAVQNQEEIRQVVLSYLQHPEDIVYVRIAFLGWKKLDHDNMKKPDFNYTIFSESHP